MASYGTIVTLTGQRLIAQYLQSGGKLGIVEFAVGDGGGAAYQPTADMTALRGERWRGTVNSVEISEDSPNVIVIDALVPAEVGGFTIREAGVFDAQGNLIGVMNTPQTEKIASIDGATTEQYVQMYLAVSSTEAIRLEVDPSAVLATREDLRRHDGDAQAHGGRMQLLEEAGEALRGELAAHRTDGEAHADIRGKIGELAASLTDKANQASEVAVTITAAGWTGNGPYSHTLTVAGVRAGGSGFVTPADTATDEQVEAFMDAVIARITRAQGQLTLVAFGDKPEINIPATVTNVG